MGYLLLSILCSVAIANLLSWFKKNQKLDILFIFAGNYCVASLFSWLTNDVPVKEITRFDLLLGILAGSFFLINFLIYQRNIIRNGQSLAVSVMRISLIIPTLFSILIFSERLYLHKYAGIIIIIAAFLYLSSSGHIKNLLLALLLFFVTGITDSFMKIYNEISSKGPSLYIAILFTGALLFTFLVIFVQGRRFHSRSLFYGFMLGIPNQLTTKFFMESLESVEAAIAYPLMASGVVLLAVVTDMWFWKRRFSGRAKMGYAALLAGIVLLNISW